MKVLVEDYFLTERKDQWLEVFLSSSNI